MKRVIIGCCVFSIGALSCLSILIATGLNLASGWETPPGRYITTLNELGLMIPLILSMLMWGIGVYILGKEYLK